MPEEEIVKTNPDPTENVKDLVHLAVKRLNDLMDAEFKRIDQLIVEKDKQYQQMNAAQKEAVTKAEVAAEKRFDSVNEFRNTLSDQQRNLMPRSEAEVKFGSISKQIDDMTTRLDKTEGKGGGINQAIGWILAGITILGFIISNTIRIR